MYSYEVELENRIGNSKLLLYYFEKEAPSLRSLALSLSLSVSVSFSDLTLCLQNTVAVFVELLEIAVWRDWT